MKITLNKLLIYITILFLPVFSYAQSPAQDWHKEILINDWTVPPGLSQQTAGVPSFYYSVTRMPNYYYNNQYYFKVYFFSGSYYTNGVWAGTYLQNIKIYVKGQFITGAEWVMFKDTYTSAAFQFYSTNPYPIVALGWSSMRIN